MPQWFLPYTAAALVAAALGWLALNYDPDAESPTATPTLAGAPAPGNPGAQQTQAPAPAPNSAGNAPATSPAPAPTSDPDPNSAGEAAVRAVVTEAMTTDRAADCTRLYTQALLEQVSGKVGADAVDHCRDNADGKADAESVDFKSLAPSGSSWRVSVTLVGGEMAGSSLDVAVVRQDGAWRLDQLLGFDIDMDQQAQIAEEEMLADGYSESESDCVAAHVSEIDEAAYERAVIEGRAEANGVRLRNALMGCLSVASLRKEIAEGIREGASGAPEALIQCVIDKIVGGKSAAELRSLIQMGQGAGYEMGRQAGIECAQMMGAAS